MKNLREKLQKLDREIAAVEVKMLLWRGFEASPEFQKWKKKWEKLDERRKAVRLERKKYVLPFVS